MTPEPDQKRQRETSAANRSRRAIAVFMWLACAVAAGLIVIDAAMLLTGRAGSQGLALIGVAIFGLLVAITFGLGAFLVARRH